MTKRKDEGSQQKLRVVTTIDDAPGKQHIDPKSGQAKILGIEQFLLPPELKTFADFMNNRLTQTERKLEATTDQNRRLANSLEAVIPKFIDQSVNHTSPDIVFGHLKEGETGDVAIANGTSVPTESLYILSAGDIAKRIGNDQMTASQMGIALRKLKIFGDSKFHHERRHGKTPLQCYKPSAIDEVYKRVGDPKAYSLDEAEVDKIANRLKPKETLS